MQARGFTCGYSDLLLVPQAEQARAALLAGAEGAAIAASARYAGVRLPPGVEEGTAEVRLSWLRGSAGLTTQNTF